MYVAQGTYRLALSDGRLNLDYSLFANDALIVDTQAPAKVTVKSKKSGAGFAMEYGEFKWLGIWTRGEGAGFLCLEPWNGIADKLEHNQNFEDKWGINQLAAGETYRASYRMEFF